MKDLLFEALNIDHWGEFWWIVIGLLGQAMFTGRFLVQWLASEKARKSVVPVAFWWFSIGGGLILLAYAVARHDPVFIIGQATGLFIYIRNLWLIRAERRAG
ncbi:lipid-A-disaccharide synthase N-terminal domain-containing protein [Frigidibacter sp. MR17.24]|uniref:lipid-A-disaccharide synthase N-terminal domain-containing protein n=1 Tax=Frigidibacter sp. MR17.24 TaxID=3127345 RepID=UPI003012DED4